MHRTAVSFICAAFLFSHPVFACVEEISQEILIDHDTTFECELHFIDNGCVSVADGVTVEILEPVTADRQTIFTGPGAVQFAGTHVPVIFPEWFGADASGATDSSLAFQKAVDALVNGGTLQGDPAAVYRLQDDVTIRNSDTLFDMQDALIKGNAIRKIRCDGDFEGHEPGDWSTALRNCIVRNVRFGDANDSENRFSGVVLRWCDECGAENIVKQGETGSGFSMSVCRNCFFRNIENYGSNPDSGKIGFLLHMTLNALVENCHAKDGPFSYAFQVKGGENATIINSSATNLFHASGDSDAVTPKIAFRERGDAPWKASATGDGTLTYPFPDKSWNEPDIRRASHNTQYVNLSVTDAPSAVAYKVQEAMGTRFHNVMAHNVRSGFVILRAVDGQESDFSIDGFLFEDTQAGAILLQSNDVTPLDTVKLRSGVIVSENAGITLNNTQDVCFAAIQKNGTALQFDDLTEENTAGTVITQCSADRDCDADVDGADLATYVLGNLEDLEGFALAFGRNDC